MISTQWFLKMQRAWPSRRSRPCTRARRVIIPAEWAKTYDHFLENIQDWCVSRQLWWGHQIPAWHCPDGAHRRSRASARRSCGAGAGRRTPTCSTPGSRARSGRSPRSAGPTRRPRSKKFYPASDLETGYDILFFWVARMMMFGLHFMGEVPFRRVLLSRPHRRRDRRQDEQGEGQRHRPARSRPRRDVRRDGRRRRCRARPRPRRSRSSRRRTRRPRDGRRASRRSAPTPCASRWPRTRRATSASRSRPSASRATGTSSTRSGTRRAWRSSSWATSRGPMATPRAAEGLLQPLDPVALRGRLRRGARGARRVPHRRGGARGLPLLLERPLRLVPRARRSRSCASSPTARSSPRRVPETRRRSPTCSRVACGSCTRSCRSSPRSSGSASRGPRRARRASRSAPTRRKDERARGPRRRDRGVDGPAPRGRSPAARTVRSEHDIDKKAEVPLRVRSGSRRGPGVPARARRGDRASS